MDDNSHVFLNNGISSNMIPVQPAAEVPVVEVPQLSLIEQFQAAEAAKQAKASVNDPYALQPSVVLPTPEQALAESQAAQGSYPAFQAGGPEDIQNLISKNSALTQAQAPAQESQNASMETVAADPAQFVAPDAPKAQQPASLSAEERAMSAFDKATNMQVRAVKAAADAGELKAMEEMGERDTIASDLADRAMKSELAADGIREQVDLQMKDLEKLRGEMAEVSKEKVDPRGLWNNASTGSKIMAGISMALGGLGGAYTGKGDNKALEIINRAIDKDIDAQKFNIGLKSQNIKDKAGITNNILSSLNQKFNNNMQAEQAARFLMLEQAKNKLEQVAAKYQGPELQAKAQSLIGKLNEEAAKSRYAFEKIASDKEVQKQMLGMAYGQYSRDLTPQQVAVIDKSQPGFAEKFVPGYGPATNKKAAEDFQTYRADTEPTLQSLYKIKELGKDLKGFKQLSPSKRAEMETMLTVVTGQMRLPLLGPGTMQEAEYKRLREAVGDPKKILSLNPVELKKLDTITKYVEDTFKTRVEQAGLVPQDKKDYTKTKGFNPSK